MPDGEIVGFRGWNPLSEDPPWSKRNESVEITGVGSEQTQASIPVDLIDLVMLPARLGPKAPALAWLERAQAY
jgi:hypothetical protein